MVEWRADVKDDPGTETVLSVFVRRSLAEVNIEVADVAILRVG